MPKGEDEIGMLGSFFWAFVVGGFICVLGQLMFDVLKLTPGHTMSTLVVLGAVLDGIGLYEPLIDFAGAGATVPDHQFRKLTGSWSDGRSGKIRNYWDHYRYLRSDECRDFSGNHFLIFCSPNF